MRTGIDKLVPIWRATAKEAAFDRGLGSHGRADVGLDACALTLAHAAVEAHDEVMGFGTRINRATDLGHPQLDSIVREDREGESELIAVERSLRLSDDHCVERSTRDQRRPWSNRDASGRRFQGSDRDWPTSKYSSTIASPEGVDDLRRARELPVA